MRIIPIGLQLRYNPEDNPFFANLSYSYGRGVSKSETIPIQYPYYMDILANTTIKTHQILVGGGYLFTKASSLKPYAGLDIGLSLYKVESLASILGSTIRKADASGTSFNINPKVGFNYAFSDNFYLDFNVHYALYLSSRTTSSTGGGGGKLNASSLLGFGIGIGRTL